MIDEKASKQKIVPILRSQHLHRTVMLKHPIFLNLFGLIIQLLILAAWSPQVAAQERYGTIAVVHYAPTQIIIAADSRNNTLKGGHTSYNDLACKVTALGKYVAFVAAGLIGYDNAGPKDLLQTWRAGIEAQRVYGELTKQRGAWQDGYLDELAKRWGDAVLPRIMSYVRLNPLSIHASAADGVLTTALIATGQGKNIQVSIIQLAIDGDNRVRVIPPRRISPDECPPCAIGKGEIVTELFARKTERAKTEMDILIQEASRLPEGKRTIHWVIRLAELTTHLHSDKSAVGGPIDALELHAGEPIHWIQRKPECLE